MELDVRKNCGLQKRKTPWESGVMSRKRMEVYIHFCIAKGMGSGGVSGKTQNSLVVWLVSLYHDSHSF